MDRKRRIPRPNNLEWLDWKYPTESLVRALFEKLVWPQGAHCPHCGSVVV